MAKYSDLRNEKQKKLNALITDCKLFFAFNSEQLIEGMQKHPLTEGDKYVSIGANGYIPKSFVPKIEQGFKEINKWYKDEIKKSKLQETEIEFELSNHEAYYTGEIEDTVDALDGRYTAEEVQKVYNKNKHLHYDD